MTEAQLKRSVKSMLGKGKTVADLSRLVGFSEIDIYLLLDLPSDALLAAQRNLSERFIGCAIATDEPADPLAVEVAA